MLQTQIDLNKACQKGWRPPEKLDLDDWADKHRYINEVSGEKWFTSTVEVARGPMKAITEPGVRTITVMCSTQTMKALDIATIIPSPDGIKTMGELQIGDRVYNECGKPCAVTAVTDHMRGKNCFLIQFSDGAELVADEGHQWLVDDNNGRNVSQITRVANTLEISKTFKNGKRNRYAIAVAAPVTGSKQNLPIPPYTLGVWLGDGHSYSAHITKHESDKELLDYVEADGIILTIKSKTDIRTQEIHLSFDNPNFPENICIRGHDMDFLGKTKQDYCAECARQHAMKYKHGHPVDDIVKPHSLSYTLTEMGLLKGKPKRNQGNAKHIPDIYLQAPEEDRWAVLQGLMDTDGTISKKRGRASFSTKTERLAKDFEKLVCSLGLKIVMKKTILKTGQFAGYEYYQGSFTAYDDQHIFRLRRKKKYLPSREGRRVSETTRRRIVSVTPVESRPVKCITVDSASHLYLASNNYIPTHNTEILLNTIGYFMHVDPCPILVVQPKDEIAKRFSNVRLKQMLRASPILRNMVEESRRRDAADTAGHKEFPGGHVTIVGSRSPGNLAMLPIRVVLLDEIDKYEESSGTEGDPIDLAEERMATYSSNSLSIRVCSPTTKGLSRIEESYETSDMRKPFTTCPHCNEKQIMMWKNVKWDKDDKGNSKAETAQYCCIHCGVLWTEGQRLKALQGIIWRQMADFTCSECEHVNTPEKWKPEDDHKWKGVRAVCEECGKGKCPNKHAGFWASKLYSPFRPLSELVERWTEAQGNIEKLKAFINTQLAETFEETGDQLTSIDGLLARREKYDELPDEVGLITAAVDVQNNRLEMEVVGWGVDEESWSLDYHIIPGDPHKPQVWVDLEEKLNKIYHREDGRISLISATCIDLGGGHTQEVANFCKDKIERRIWPIRGIASAGRPYPVWPKNPGRTAKINLPFYNVGVDAGKNVIFSRMLIETPGPGYCHLPHDRDLSWFEQFTAERRVQKRKGTQMYYVWENKKNARNESFDIRGYAYAALCGLQSMGWSVNIITEEQRLIMDSEYEEVIEKRVTDTVGRQTTSSPRRRTRRVNKSSYASR